jgi:predicted enzyme related to lactoylglutathione lyase
MGKKHGGYIVAHTGETTEDGMLKETGIINGGFYHADKKKPAQYPTLVIAVYDLKKAMKKIEKAGGKIIDKPVDIPGFGTYISFYDTEGNRMEIIEPDEDWKERTK